MSNKELKPCPFCGGEAELYYYFGSVWVHCMGCDKNFKIFDTAKDAIKAWNTRNYPEKQDSSNSSEFPNSSNVAKPEECCKKSCKDENTTLPSWHYLEWNHQFNFSTCTILISQSVQLDFTVRRANNDLNTDKWEAYSELGDFIHDTLLSEEQIIFGVSRKEAIEKCNDAIKQIGNGFLELYNKNRKVEL